jgi:hypothetical protein
MAVVPVHDRATDHKEYLMDRFDYSKLTAVDTESLRRKADRVRTLLATLTPAAIEVGTIIADARDKIPHGQFGAWCVAALGIDRRRAQLYMKLAEFAAIHGREQVEKLPLTAVHHMAAQSTPAAVVQQVLERAANGDIPTAGAVRALIRETSTLERVREVPRSVDDEIDILSELLRRSLDSHDLYRLARFAAVASPDAMREFGSRLASLTSSSRFEDAA